jgi:hypothetical protein
MRYGDAAAEALAPHQFEYAEYYCAVHYLALPYYPFCVLVLTRGL